MSVRAAVAVVLLVAAPAPARAACPTTAGFDALTCEVAEARSDAWCAHGRARNLVRRTLVAVTRRAAAARRAADGGLDRLAVVRLEQAADRVTRLRARLTDLAARGRVPGDCATALDAALERVATVLGTMIGGPPASSTTTTTHAGPSSTAGISTTTVTPTTATTTATVPSTCGNGRLDFGEQCDGSNLFGRDCATLGFTGGTLACRPDCLFDTSHCTF